MGIKGSATCVLNFDQATGYMIGIKRQRSECNVYHDESWKE